MRTFKLTLGLDMTITVPDSFTAEMREEATGLQQTKFLALMNEKFKNDDEGFTLALLQRGIRDSTRLALVDLCRTSGLGIRLAPASVSPNNFVIPEKTVTEPDSGESEAGLAAEVLAQ